MSVCLTLSEDHVDLSSELIVESSKGEVSLGYLGVWEALFDGGLLELT